MQTFEYCPTEDTRDTEWSDVPIDRPGGSASLPTVDEAKTDSSRGGKLRRLTVVSLLLGGGVIVAIIIGISIGLSGKSESRHPPTLAELVDFLKVNNVSSATGGPQMAAAKWMAEDDALGIPLPRSLDTSEGYAYIERYVMALLYFQNGGKDWKHQMNWLESDSICDWRETFFTSSGTSFSSGCLCTTDYASGLYLDVNTLKGFIPHEIGLLTKLQALDLGFGELTGAIPTSICQLTGLTTLSFNFNQLQGSIPTCIGALSSLKKLYLSDNQITGSIPKVFSNLTTLESLFLDDNMLSGRVTTLFNQMSSLLEIYLENNSLSGQIGNNFLKDASSLFNLDISGNQFTGVFPGALLAKQNFQLLDLSHNHIGGKLPRNIAENKALKYLSVNNNAFTGTIPDKFLTNLKSVFHLDLSSNNFTGDMPTEIGNMTLYRLFLANNSFTPGPIPESYGNLAFIGLDEMSLKSTNRNGTLPEFLGQMGQLTFLALDDNNLSGTIPTVFQYMFNLQFLLLDHNKLVGTFPTELAKLTGLRVLSLENNNLTGNLTHMCALPAFQDPTGDTNGNELLSADDEISCECCIHCPYDVECLNHERAANLEGSWETGYSRVDYVFGDDSRFVDSSSIGN